MSLVCISFVKGFFLPCRACPLVWFWLPSITTLGSSLLWPPFFFLHLESQSLSLPLSPNHSDHNLQKYSTPTHVQQQIAPSQPPSLASTYLPLRLLSLPHSLPSHLKRTICIYLPHRILFLCHYHFYHPTLWKRFSKNTRGPPKVSHPNDSPLLILH